MRTKKEPVRLRAKGLADGSQSLYLDIYRDGERSYEFLKLYLLPGKDKETRRRNREVLEAAEAIKCERIMTLSALRSGRKREQGWRRLRLSSWLDMFRTDFEAGGGRGGAALRSMAKAVCAYRPEIRMGELDREWALGVNGWLRSEFRTSRGFPLAESTAACYAARLSTALNAAVRSGKLDRNPFIGLTPSEKLRMPETHRHFLTREELQAMVATECRYPEVKRAYLFSCHCGLRISDIRAMRWSDIKTDGECCSLSIVMKKNGRPLNVPLSESALEWLPPRGKDPDLVFNPLPSLPTIERALREWTRGAGITKEVTFHTSRHTFATMMLTAGADLYTTSKLLGHADIATTQIYAKVVDRKKLEAVEMLDRLLGCK